MHYRGSRQYARAEIGKHKAGSAAFKVIHEHHAAGCFGHRAEEFNGLHSQVRPAALARDLLDDINANGASPFEWRSPTLTTNRAFNDHFAVIDKNP